MLAPSRQTTIDEKGNRLWIYPQAIRGWFTNRREWVSYGLIILYLAMPWVTINGLPLIQLNVSERQFILAGTVFWPQDIKYLVFLLIAGGISLFFFAAIAGRVWCGWGCPQTVFLEFVFRKIENKLEGERSQRMAFDRAPWGPKKITIKLFKQLIFLAIATVVANTFLAYFVGVDQVLQWMTRPPSEHWGAFLFMMANLLLFYFDFAWFREQFCTTLCPYARFQSALTDENTFQVTYDFQRGEPRGKLNQAEGDCIDCGACVRVCPTGIDIRHGTQLECIGCARCIDACDDIMHKVKRPTGLVRYASESEVEGVPTKMMRPRVMIYSLLLIFLLGGFVWSVKTRPMVEMTILRSPGAPYTVLQNGKVSNHLTLSVVNKLPTSQSLTVKLEGMDSAELIVPIHPFPISASAHERMEIFVNFDPEYVPIGKQEVSLVLQSADGETQTYATGRVTLLGPASHERNK